MKYAKKSIVFVLFCSVILLASCDKEDQKTSSSDTDELRKMSDTVIEKMQTITSDEQYQMLIGSPDETKKILADWRKCPPDASADILVIPITEKLIPPEEASTSGLDQLKDTTREYVIRRIASSLNARLNSTYAGTAAIAASSVAQYSETFRIDTDSFTNQVWIIPCTDSVGILVDFIDTGDNVATVSAAYCALPEPESRDALLPLLFGGSSYEEIGAYYLPS